MIGVAADEFMRDDPHEGGRGGKTLIHALKNYTAAAVVLDFFRLPRKSPERFRVVSVEFKKKKTKKKKTYAVLMKSH